jgi:hypothetical protein
MGAAIIACGDVPPVLEPAETVFDLVTLLVEGPIESCWILRVFFGGMQGSIHFPIKPCRNQSLS